MHANRYAFFAALSFSILVSAAAPSWAATPWIAGQSDADKVKSYKVVAPASAELALTSEEQEADEAWDALLLALPGRYGWDVSRSTSDVEIPTVLAASVNPLARMGGAGLLLLFLMCGLLVHGVADPQRGQSRPLLGRLDAELWKRFRARHVVVKLVDSWPLLASSVETDPVELLEVPEPENMDVLPEGPETDCASQVEAASLPVFIDEATMGENPLDPPESTVLSAVNEAPVVSSALPSPVAREVVDGALLDAPAALALDATTPPVRPSSPILSLDEAMSAPPSMDRPELGPGANHGPDGERRLAANHAPRHGLEGAANQAPTGADAPAANAEPRSAAPADLAGASLSKRHRAAKRASFAHGAAAANGASIDSQVAEPGEALPAQPTAQGSAFVSLAPIVVAPRPQASARRVQSEAPSASANHVPVAVVTPALELSPEEMLANIPWWLEGATEEDCARLSHRQAFDERSLALDRVRAVWGARELSSVPVADSDAPGRASSGTQRPSRRGYAALAALLSPGMILLATLLVPALLGFDVALAADGADAALRLELGGEGAGQSTTAVKLLVILTLLAVAPAIVLSMTSFTRLIVVFSLLRQAIGVQQAPPNQILVGLALFLTWFVMAPTFNDVNRLAVQPYFEGQMNELEAVDAALGPMRDFMLRNTRPSDLGLFLKLNRQEKPASAEDVPTPVLVPAFIISELKTAFSVGFLIYIPFLIIDIVVSTILLAMGMMVLPPVVISMPFKLLLFVFVDGWNLLVGSMVSSFA